MRASLPVVALLFATCGGSTSPSADTTDIAEIAETGQVADTSEPPDTNDTTDGDAVITPPEGATTQELIRQALADGRLDQDTALVYRVFAAFSDERLPIPYRGRSSHDSLVGAELVARYAELSPEHRAAVYPFTLPPPAEGSWWALRDSQSPWPDDAPPHLLPPPTCLAPFSERGPWIPLDSEHFRVWYSERWRADLGGQSAAAVLEALEDYLWPLLTGLMQSTPVSDAGQPCNGNDGRLDIYVLRFLGEYGSPLTMPFPTDCHQPRAAYIVLPTADDDLDALLATTAHEFLHALQFSFPVLGECMDYLGGPLWFTEGTAVWAEGYAYPSLKERLRSLLTGGMWATPFDGLSSEAAAFARYRSYPFWKHLTEVHEEPDLIRQLFEALAVFPEHGDALAHVLPRGLELDFLDFAVQLLNEPPDDAWRSWLGLEGGPATSDIFPQLDGGALATSIGAMSVNAFGVRYWHIEPEDDARLFAFDNPIAEMQVPGLKLHAVRKLADGTLAAPLDWTAIDTPVLCRDDPSDDFASLYLLMTWADPKEIYGRVTAPRPGRLVVAATPCRALTGHSDVTLAMNEQVGAFSVSTEEKISASYSFTRAAIDAEGGQVAIEFVPSGSLTWSMSSSVVAASDPPFSASCPAGPVDANILHEHGTLGFVIDKDGQALWFANGRIPIGPLPWTDCFGEASTMTSEPYWLYVGDQLLPFEGAASLSGSFRRDGLDASWRFTR